MRHWWRWLYPGLCIKRWMLLFSVGILLCGFGATLILNYRFVGIAEEWVFRLVYELTGRYNLFLPALAGGISLGVGLACILYAMRRIGKRFLALLAPEATNASEQMLSRVLLARGPRITALGGGHGLSNLLRGLKMKSSNLTAIVTVADDGGSSGRLRDEMGIIAPGDLRNCLVALADKESLLEESFQYRFGGKGELSGHSLGNLFIAALIDEFGSVENGLSAASKILNIRGRVIPATTERVTLCALMEDGRIVAGETEIAEYPAKICKMSTIPETVTGEPDAAKAISESDLIVLGPGSLYTSILPNLLVPEIAKALRETKAPCIYICNVMTQPGETDGFTAGDHLEALIRHVGDGLIDFVLVNTETPSEETLARYRAAGAEPVSVDTERIRAMGVQVIAAPLLGEARGAVHDPIVLAEELIHLKNILNAKISPEVLDAYLERGA